MTGSKKQGKNIYQRMSAISADAEQIPKNGYNSYSKYKYIQAVDVVGSIKKLLIKHGVYLQVSEEACKRESHGKNFHSTILCIAKFTNIDNPEEAITVTYNSVSADTLDKDIFKAKTNGLKYLFTQQFLLVTDDFIDTEEEKPQKINKAALREKQDAKRKEIDKKRDKLLGLLNNNGTQITRNIEDWVDGQPENIIDQQIERMEK